MSDKFKEIDNYIVAVTDWGDTPVIGCRKAMDKFKDDESRWYCFGKLLLWCEALCLNGVSSKSLILYGGNSNSVIIINVVGGMIKNSYTTVDTEGNVIVKGSYDTLNITGSTPLGNITFNEEQLNTTILKRDIRLLPYEGVKFFMTPFVMNQFDDFYDSLEKRKNIRQYLNDNFFTGNRDVDICVDLLIRENYSPLAIVVQFQFKPKYYMPEYVLYHELQRVPPNSFFTLNNFIGHTGHNFVNLSYFLILNGVTIDNCKITTIMSTNNNFIHNDVNWSKVVYNNDSYQRKTDYYKILVDKNIGYKYPSC